MSVSVVLLEGVENDTQSGMERRKADNKKTPALSSGMNLKSTSLAATR
jgi:hypothetical protein